MLSSEQGIALELAVSKSLALISGGPGTEDIGVVALLCFVRLESLRRDASQRQQVRLHGEWVRDSKVCFIKRP